MTSMHLFKHKHTCADVLLYMNANNAWCKILNKALADKFPIFIELFH